MGPLMPEYLEWRLLLSTNIYYKNSQRAADRERELYAIQGDFCLDIEYQTSSNNLTKIKEGVMKRLFYIIPMVFLLCFAFGCQKQAEEVAEEPRVEPLSDEDVAAIKALGPAIDEMGIAGDWDAFTKLFAENLIMMVPNMPAIKGNSAYRDFLISMNVKMTKSNYEIQEIFGYGDLAYATATYTETFSLGDSEESIYDEGKILTILRKQPDGSWLFSRWMWASNLPLPE